VLKQRLHNAEVDVNYTQYYPLMKVYSSLYPKSKKEKATDPDEAMDEDNEDKTSREVDGPKGDIDMWKAIEKAMAEGTLDALRNRKEGIPAAAPKKEKKKTQAQVVNKKDVVLQKKLAEAKNRREEERWASRLKKSPTTATVVSSSSTGSRQVARYRFSSYYIPRGP
jgi:hypothetical protein